MMQEIPDVGNTSGINSRNMHEQMLNIKTIKLHLSMCHNKFRIHQFHISLLTDDKPDKRFHYFVNVVLL